MLAQIVGRLFGVPFENHVSFYRRCRVLQPGLKEGLLREILGSDHRL